MNQIKIFQLIMLAVLVFTFACESGTGDGNDRNNSTIDSLNTVLNTYEAEEKALSEQITVLQDKLNEEPEPQEVKVIYKTKVKYKTDERVLADLKSQKTKVQNQDSEIGQLKDSINQKESELDEMKNLIEDLESKSNELVDTVEIERTDSIIKGRLAVSDIEVILYTRKIKDEEKKGNAIEIIETSFTVNENKLASIGDKSIHLCIYDGDKKVLHHEEESGKFTPVYGREQFYTYENQFAYNEEKLRMTISWEKKELELKPGMYTTEFYIDNVFSGIGVFNVE